MNSFEYLGKSILFWTQPESSFSALFLPDALETNSVPDVAFTRRLNLLAPPGALSWWTDRHYDEFDREFSSERFLVELIENADLPFEHRPRAAFGGEAAVRLGFRHPLRFPVVAAWNGNFDFHDLYGQGTSLDYLFDRREQARQQTAILQVRSNDFPPHIWFGCPAGSAHYRGNDRLHEKLNAIGVPHQFVLTDDCPSVAMADFLVAALRTRSRRLL